MANGNTITIIGNVTRDPELRYLTSGTALAQLGVAVNRRYMQNNEWQEETSFFDVVCWRELADNVSESISKGDRIIVTGRLEQRSWETQDGDKRSKVEIVADEVGPSLRWATARIEKIRRDHDDIPIITAVYSGNDDPSRQLILEAFVAEATFATVPAHPHAATALLMFPDLAAATPLTCSNTASTPQKHPPAKTAV